ncbi:MAG: cysteine desulfurase [bacterium]
MIEIKKDFPILNRKINGKKLVYLDNAATTQKPSVVVNSISSFYLNHNANIHRGIHTLSEESTKMFDDVYKKVAIFINASLPNEIVITNGATGAINMAALCLKDSCFWDDAGEIIVTEMEHHSNILPWMNVLNKNEKINGFNGIKNLKIVRVTDEGLLDLDHLATLLNHKTKIVAVSHVSNVLGTINPIKEIVRLVKSRSNALVLVDGAQAVPHIKVNVQKLGCDFYAFSSHKMLGPTGVGVLCAKEEILKKLPPAFFGGGMIKEVYFDKAVWEDLPNKFNVGTPDIAGVVGFGTALDYLTQIGMDKIEEYEKTLTSYCISKFLRIPYVKIYGSQDISKRSGVISFNVEGVHPHDLASILDSEGIAIRSGHHCAMPLHTRFNINSSARASFYLYNEKEDVDVLIKGIEKARKIFKLD